MLNPSTADAVVDDPTIKRVIGFSTIWGWGGFVVYNLFALRATDPQELTRHPDPIGPENDKFLDRIEVDRCVVAAWGSKGTHQRRDRIVSERLINRGVRLSCLGTNSDGTPKHPLYLASSTMLTAFSA